MSIPPIPQSPFDVTKYIRQDTLLNKIPAELLDQCLFKLDLRSLLQFPLISKEYYVVATKSDFWAAVAKALNLKVAPPINKTVCQEGYKLKKQCNDVIYQSLQLNQKLGPEICQQIDTFPIWNGAIKYDDDEDFLNLSQFNEQKLKDEQAHFFKTVIDQDLYLILITSNRWNSRVVWFNSAFNIDSRNEKEPLYWEYRVGMSSGFHIKGSEKPMVKQLECQQAWASMKDTLCRILSVKFIATNLSECSVDVFTQWINSITKT